MIQHINILSEVTIWFPGYNAKKDQVFRTIYMEAVVVQSIGSQNSDVLCLVTDLMIHHYSIHILCSRSIAECTDCIHFGLVTACSTAKQEHFSWSIKL